MDWLNSIIKVEHPFLDPPALHALLAAYGSIDAFIPCNTDDPSPRQFFIRFSSAKAAQRACDAQLAVQGLRVLTLSQDPCLLDHYLTLCSSSLGRHINHASICIPHTPKRDAYIQPKTRRAPKGRKTGRIVGKRGPEQSACANERTSASLGNRKKYFSKQAMAVPGPAPKEPRPTLATSAPDDLLRSPATAVSDNFCMATKVKLRIAGEQLTFDLNKLEDDPKSIIELLKLASAERAHWLVLLMELIQVLEGQNVGQDEMKPIYLMLSGCETDLAKHNKAHSSIHYVNAQTWLQKVYGTYDS
ncbi:hypothetical protein APHAL10511_004833 [Amanita phalloides]|nr:hypothetical protein APHAL10511_004833 [Amanita phalloides]